jgi:hypothetical protein
MKQTQNGVKKWQESLDEVTKCKAAGPGHTNRDETDVRPEIENLVRQKAEAPLGGRGRRAPPRLHKVGVERGLLPKRACRLQEILHGVAFLLQLGQGLAKLFLSKGIQLQAFDNR